MVRIQPTERLNVIIDFYRLLLDGLHLYVLFLRSLVCDYMEIEVLLNSRSELYACMMHEGLLRVIGEIVMTETDPLVLVCFASSVIHLSFIEN